MSTPTLDTYESYREATKDADLLGWIIWFTVSGADVPPDTLKSWFAELSLDPAFLPNPINPLDSFRTATSPKRVSTSYQVDRARTATLMIRDVPSKAGITTRHVIREVRDANKQKLAYGDAEVAQLVFYNRPKTGGHMTRFTPNDAALTLRPDEPQLVRGFIREIERRYEHLNGHYQSQALRGVLRNYILSLNAVSVRRSGGVYFALADRKPTLDKLADLTRRFGQGSLFHMLPLPATTDQHTMLTQAFAEEVSEKCADLNAQVAQIRKSYLDKGRAVPHTKYAELIKAWKALADDAQEYTDVIGVAQAEAGISLEGALATITDLAEHLADD